MSSGSKLDDVSLLVLEEIDDVAIVTIDRDGIVTGWFRGAERVFGWSSDEMIGQPMTRLFTPEDNAHGVPLHEMEVAIATGRADDDRWEVRKDGTRIWVTGVLIALRDASGEFRSFVKLMRDRSDLRAQIAALENRVEALGRAAERKDHFLSTLAHELRNPLAPLVNALALLRLGNASQSEGALQMIDRQVTILRRLVDDLMDVGRIASGKVELARRHIVLNEVLRTAADACRPLAENRRQRFEVLLLPTPIAIHADPDRLHQVFSNLLENAVKYTPENGRIWLKATIEGNDAVVRVEDSGIGIAAEALPRIFDLFTQEESARGMAGGGLGLGLSIVRDLVALHGGTIAVRSDGRNQGSEFVVRLPRQLPETAPSG